CGATTTTAATRHGCAGPTAATTSCPARRSSAARGSAPSRAGEVALAGPDQDRLALDEVGDEHRPLADGRERAVARVARLPRGAALEALGVLAHRLELPVGLGVEVADGPPAR